MERAALDIHVINLDRSKDRLSKFEALNGHLQQNFLRFPALEGINVARPPLVDRGIITADLGYGDGALGNALSHLALWDLAIEKNQAFTVCEDDAIFNRGFGAAGESLIKALPQDWHVILWGWNFDSIVLFDMIPGVSPCLGIFDQDRMRMGIDAFQSAPLMPQPFRLFNAFGVVGYSVSPMGAQAMKRHSLPLRNMDVFIPGLGRAVPNRSLDIMLNDVYPRVNAYVSFPPLIITRNFHSNSTVQQAL
jgi:GR25 family glycosyltransferase involved in LPS biosynthesis